ncbi:LysR family transcriptional regulator [Roseovarius sp. LXJ103]|uniref:LysR family transcriptional regulator n=1 Tax=Roseovarius carneus TaxID=2853164 RepID=UPI000D60C1F6|nr:LysR family transcriptional regulator [Roseovarius carneus]MBZ8117073.1 LysR family transcriptional regulator [Roseovarius carneus]PWE37078.1 LysR family transcriptional regulator [Pelagicola sp. LXJ1103]
MKLTGSDIHLLGVFDAVVRSNGFSAAQVELGLSQPTISNHIRALEERLGVKLCQRGRRGFLLTEKGRMVHKIGMAVIANMQTHSAHLAALKGNLVGPLKVVVVDCVASDAQFRLPAAIAELASKAPAVRIELGIAGPQDILNGILNGTWHIGIGSFDNAVNGLAFKDLYSEPHALYAAPSHPLASRSGSISQDEVERHPWAHRGYWSRRRQKSYTPSDLDRFVHEIEAQILLVLSGAYLGLLPEHQAASFVAAGRLRKLAFEARNFACTMQTVTRAGALPKVNALFLEMVHTAHQAP